MRKLTGRLALALGLSLLVVPAATAQLPEGVTQTMIDQGQTIFNGVGICMVCHGTDAKGMPTTLGSVLFDDYYPDRDAFVVEKLKKAGAIILGKATLGELGGGDTHGSLFGSTRNPYALDRTVGGSSGGSAASVTANFATVAVGQEGLASIRRPSTWNSIVGMRPTAGLVSRGGVYAGWPDIHGSLGPMARKFSTKQLSV